MKNKNAIYSLVIFITTLLVGCGANSNDNELESDNTVDPESIYSSYTDEEWELALESAYWDGWYDAIAVSEDNFNMFDHIETDIFGEDNSQEKVKKFFEEYEERKKSGEGKAAESRAKEIQDKKEYGFRIGDEVLLNDDNETSMKILSLEEVDNDYYHYLLKAEFYNDEGYDVSFYASNISGDTGNDGNRLIFFTELYNTDEEYADVITIPTGQSQTIEVEISVNYSLEKGSYMVVEYMDHVNWVIFYEELG
ncbi:hypothetical protein ABC345_19975 [Shouchella sp. 1P09AA]|uniref:hypothetical protein n=1 Tax=unclassified Shouchella TaxID=2893065 RepID=UPI0039A31F90